jgi:hypothetical protein
MSLLWPPPPPLLLGLRFFFLPDGWTRSGSGSGSGGLGRAREM